jgi:nucleotidyltransferase substrate binding protein (TIGR01987 family)
VTKSQLLRADFARAVTRLDEALALPKDPIVRDSAIQRFEISFELCWKFLKAYLEDEHNALCTSPGPVFARHSNTGSSTTIRFWIDLTVLRNYTVHTYNEQLADSVYSRLTETARRFRAVLAATEC